MTQPREFLNDYTDYENALKETADLKGEEKLQQLRALRERISAFERRATSDWSIPLYTVKRIKDLLPEIDAGINRLTAKAKP